jgi:hypothetical protein
LFVSLVLGYSWRSPYARTSKEQDFMADRGRRKELLAQYKQAQPEAGLAAVPADRT